MSKSVWMSMLLLLVAGATFAPRALAQAAIYGEFSGTKLTNLVGTNYAFGATTGILYEGEAHRHVVFAGNIQGRFVRDGVENLNGITVGPRVELPLKRFRMSPYAEFMIGFARYNNNGLNISTTDSTIQINGGIMKELTPHWDATLDYSYAQYYGLGGQFNPKTFSIGGIYHFMKR